MFIFIACLNLCLLNEAISRETSPMICGACDGVCGKMWVKATVKNARHNKAFRVEQRRKLVMKRQTLSWFRFPIFPHFYFPAFKITETKINETVLILNFLTSPTGKRWMFSSHAMNACWEGEAEIHIFLTAVLDGSDRLVLQIGHLNSGERSCLGYVRSGGKCGRRTMLKIWAISFCYFRSVNVLYSYVFN